MGVAMMAQAVAMPDTHIAAARGTDRSTAHRMAAGAAAKAKRLWPDVIGDVLADEIMALLDLPPWLRSLSRTQQLIDAVLSIAEGEDPQGPATRRCAEPPGS